MPDQRPQSPNRRPPSKTPAERSAEFDAKQRRLKEEAAQRRQDAEAKSAGEKEPPAEG